jgi:hypothetical protein
LTTYVKLLCFPVTIGAEIQKNLTVEELEKTIDGLIKSAGQFYYASPKNKAILHRWSKYTHLAKKPEPINNNDTGYSDQEVKELLKTYDTRFKKPLKQYLVEYYRLKLNPDIKMEGEYLEQLGFNPCGHCHDDKYVPSQEVGELKFTSDFMLSNSNFFMTLFSMYHSFSEDQLIRFKDKLIFGSIEESHHDLSIPQTMYAQYGLNFNSKVIWTDEVRKAYWVEPYLIHAFGSEDVWYKRNFEALPLSKEIELDFFRNRHKNWAFAYSEDYEETMECIESDKMFSTELEDALNQTKIVTGKQIQLYFF